MVDKETMKIICLSFCNGKKHDFRLFKESKVHIQADTLLETDTGYTGITEIHSNSLLPKNIIKVNLLQRKIKEITILYPGKEFMWNML